MCWPVAGRSAVLTGLYQAEVLVPDQSDTSQKEGVANALLNVLIKLTGDRKVQDRAGVANLLQHPEQYVQQYQFHKKPVIVNNQLTLDEQLYLWVSFNSDILDKAMQNINLPQWGSIRPVTLLWLVTQQGQDRKFISLEDELGYAAVIDGRAQQRGIPVVYPLLDSEDSQMVKETDVIGGILDPFRKASQRYATDVVVIGTLSNVSATSWEGRWTMLLDNEPVTWSVKGANAEQALYSGIDRLADELASRFVHATAKAGESGVEIEVKDIDDFDQYSKVLKYLRTLNSVVSVDIKAVEPGSVTYSVIATGGEFAVVRAIELGKTLKSLGESGSPYRLLH